MLIGDYEFHCVFDTPALLPPYKGSTLRGALGHALKKTVCALRRQDCAECLLSSQCLYIQLFASQPSNGRKTLNGAVPQPYVLTVPITERRAYEPGDKLKFGLSLFGSAIEKLPYLLYAVETMGRSGIGRRTDEVVGRFNLERVSSRGNIVYSAKRRALEDIETAEFLTLSSPCDTEVSKLTIRFETPLRFKHTNRLKDQLPFHILIRTMLRRAASLLAGYGDGEPELDYKGLIERAKAVTMIHNRMRWRDWQRYSNRQRTGMLMGGMVGSITYEGELSEFFPLITFCSRVHVGKQTSFGLGRFTFEVEA